MKKILRHITIFLVALFSQSSVWAQINTDQVMRIGQNVLYFEDYVLSIQYFNQVIQAKPYLAQPYLLRSIAKLNLDDYYGAIDDATKALSINPFIPDAWEVRGVAQQNLGRNMQAVADYDEALALLPHNRNILFNRALALEEEGNIEAADSTISEILKYYQNYDRAYLGRAKLRLAVGDTIAAEADINRALELNPDELNGYLMRAAIAIDSHKDFAKALTDMDKAITLQPRLAGLYINRAYLRHELDDYFGSMADSNYALELEPLNSAALFNRSLLLMEVGDNDRALFDLNRLLSINPDDERALYNRSIVYSEKRDYDNAIADISAIIQRLPSFSSAYFMRSEFYREKGDMRQAKADYDQAMALAKKNAAHRGDTPIDGNTHGITDDAVPEELTREAAAKRFNALLTIDNDTKIDGEYNNQAIRGRVQDRDLQIDIEPLIEVALYSSPTELSQNTYVMKEVEDINNARLLRAMIFVTSKVPNLDDPDVIKRHFESIEYFNSYIATHEPRTIDYLGRALDYITVRNYEAAIADLNRAIALSPDHALAYMLRAQAQYHQRYGTEQSAISGMKTDNLKLVLSDLDQALEYSPRTAPLWFNKGNILYEMGDLTGAIEAYSRAIELMPTMGEAYFNRGYVKLKLGNETAGIDDLSKAGELGKISAYNLIKRIRNIQ